jgi:hypothetical protein
LDQKKSKNFSEATTLSTSNIAVKSPRWQWSLKDLMLWMAFLAIFSAMVSYLGLDNGLLWICAIYAIILTSVFVLFVPRQISLGPWLAIAAGIFFLCNPLLMFISLVTLINCVLHLIFLIVVKTRKLSLSAKRVAEVSIAMTLFTFGIGILFGISGYRDLMQARKEFAPQDLTLRLAYETRPGVPNQPGLSANEFRDSQWGKFEFELQGLQERESNFFGRQWALEGIHTRHVEAFVKSPGFGVGRFFVPTPERARLPEIRSIPFEGPSDWSSREDSWRKSDFWPIDSRRDLGDFHFTGLKDFLQPETFGLMLEPRMTRGFQSHAFHFQPEITSDDEGDEDDLVLNRLQLVSLTRFDTPRAYVLDHLPRMDQLSSDNVPTRDLTLFESAALKLLQGGEDIVVEAGGRRVETVVGFRSFEARHIEMLGAIRAVEGCLPCHAASRGELLGVFSYQFTNYHAVEDRASGVPQDVLPVELP